MKEKYSLDDPPFDPQAPAGGVYTLRGRLRQILLPTGLATDNDYTRSPGLARQGYGGVTVNWILRNGRLLQRYNDLAWRNGSGRCGEATMPRDNPSGLFSPMFSSAGANPLALHNDNEKSHRTIDRHALKIPVRRAEYSLTENVASLCGFQSCDSFRDVLS
jgi:hypothetical protein